MNTHKNPTLRLHSRRDMNERISFIRTYVERLKKNPNEVFKEQVEFINSLMKSAKTFPLSKKEYLKMKGELRD
ncbi:hypothetical protein E3E27_04940 [Thermococcus sp. MV11]|nr:hypothetical protein [Thermococcus sp. MV11]